MFPRIFPFLFRCRFIFVCLFFVEVLFLVNNIGLSLHCVYNFDTLIVRPLNFIINCVHFKILEVFIFLSHVLG